MIRIRRFAVIFIAAVSPVRSAGSQPYAAQTRHISASVGVSWFDLSGTGTAPMAAVRVGFPLSRVVLVEPGIAVERPEQQFDYTTTLLVPELAMQFQIPRRIAPYLGIGVGAATDVRPERFGGTRTRPTLSGALGVRAGLSPRGGVLSEIRLRGIGQSFGGSAMEWTIGGFRTF